MRIRLLAIVALLGVCATQGACTPSERDIYHDSALRPGTVEASSGDEVELLARLGSTPAGAIEIAGASYEILPSYASASGRRCAPIVKRTERGEHMRLACEIGTERGTEWVFVPDVMGAETEPTSDPRGTP